MLPALGNTDACMVGTWITQGSEGWRWGIRMMRRVAQSYLVLRDRCSESQRPLSEMHTLHHRICTSSATTSEAYVNVIKGHTTAAVEYLHCW